MHSELVLVTEKHHKVMESSKAGFRGDIEKSERSWLLTLVKNKFILWLYSSEFSLFNRLYIKHLVMHRTMFVRI